MEETIRTTIRQLKAALDKMEMDACASVKSEETSVRKFKAMYNFGEVILKLSNILDEAGYTP